MKMFRAKGVPVTHVTFETEALPDTPRHEYEAQGVELARLLRRTVPVGVVNAAMRYLLHLEVLEYLERKMGAEAEACQRVHAIYCERTK